MHSCQSPCLSTFTRIPVKARHHPRPPCAFLSKSATCAFLSNPSPHLPFKFTCIPAEIRHLLQPSRVFLSKPVTTLALTHIPFKPPHPSHSFLPKPCASLTRSAHSRRSLRCTLLVRDETRWCERVMRAGDARAPSTGCCSEALCGPRHGTSPGRQLGARWCAPCVRRHTLKSKPHTPAERAAGSASWLMGQLCTS